MSMYNKRLMISIISGSVLGGVCILGASLRYPDGLETSYLFAFWFNRLLMGLIFGLLTFKGDLPYRVLKGASLGLVISFAFYSATEFMDVLGFLVGAMYGAIIILVNYFLLEKPQKKA